eukprot:99843_1
MDVASDDDDDDDGNEELIQEIISSLTEEDMNCLKSTLDNDGTNNQSNEQRIHTTNHTNSKLKMYPIQNNLDENTATRMESIQHNAVNSNDNTPRNTQPTNTIQHTKHTKHAPHHDDTSEVKANESAPSSLIQSPNKIKQIDEALATYYASVGVHDYFDSNGIGRFHAFIEREAFDVDPLSIEQELGTQSIADNTMYTEFDAQFPFHDNVLQLIEDLKIDKANIIFYILQYCYQHNRAPTNERIYGEFEVANTYMDQLYNHAVHEVNVTSSHVNKLEMWLNDHGYDSEVVKWDMKRGHTSFIAEHCENDDLRQSVISFANQVELSSSSFQVGFAFYYWPYYESLETLPISDEWFNSVELHTYSPRESYVKQRHANFKEEISNYKFIDMEAYETTMVKVNALLETNSVKSLKAADIPHLHCDIKPNDPLLPRHLLSLFLYQDHTDLSEDFCSTFIRLKPFEALSAVKARNSHYWWMSKSLCETVQLYGQSGEGEYNEKTGKYENKLCGPFYCGLSRVMPLDGMSIQINGPFSTSLTIETAINFAGREGIVVQFDNTADYYSKRVRGFPCVWLSDFKEEDAVLFFGSDCRLRVESIRILQGKGGQCQNFEAFCGAIFKFECMLNGCRPQQKIEMSSDDLSILSFLCDWRLGKKEVNGKIDRYALDAFSVVCSRAQIAFNLWCLDTLLANELTDLLMQSIKPQHVYDDISNLFKPDLFKICTNIEKVIIHSSSRDGKIEYAFNLLSLLSILSTLKRVPTIIIKSRVPFKSKKRIGSASNDDTPDFDEHADVNTDDEEISDSRSWIYNMWQQHNGQSRMDIEKAFGANGLAISYSQTGTKQHEDCLTIKESYELREQKQEQQIETLQDAKANAEKELQVIESKYDALSKQYKEKEAIEMALKERNAKYELDLIEMAGLKEELREKSESVLEQTKRHQDELDAMTSTNNA